MELLQNGALFLVLLTMGKINTVLLLNVVKLDLSNYVCPGRIVENTSARATHFLNIRLPKISCTIAFDVRILKSRQKHLFNSKKLYFYKSVNSESSSTYSLSCSCCAIYLYNNYAWLKFIYRLKNFFESNLIKGEEFLHMRALPYLNNLKCLKNSNK